jgi:hypothetical protein
LRQAARAKMLALAPAGLKAQLSTWIRSQALVNVRELYVVANKYKWSDTRVDKEVLSDILYLYFKGTEPHAGNPA